MPVTDNSSIRFVDFYAVCYKVLKYLRLNKDVMKLRKDFKSFLDAFDKCVPKMEIDYDDDFIRLCPKCFSTEIESIIEIDNESLTTRCLACKYETVEYKDVPNDLV